ncbi:MAG: S9 family peptidase [Deltaproteobacteria bacterium]|nr:S9 family peptidase [Deltaproteobacteria bacterium]
MRSSGTLALVLTSVVTVASFAACGGESTPPPVTPRKSVIASIASDAPKDAPPPKKAPPRADASLVPRATFFSNPDRARPQLSPDGKRIAWLSSVDGVLNVWVAPTGDLAKAKAVTQDKKRGIRSYRWAFTNDHVIYLQDKDGDENWHIHAVDVNKGTDKDLTPGEGAQARIEALSHRSPTDILVGLNDRDKKWHDVHRVNLVTGEKKLLQKNEGFFAFVADDDLKIRLGMKPLDDGGTSIQEPDGKGAFKEISKIPHEDTLTTQVAGIDGTGKKAYVVDSRGRDTAAVVELDLATKKTKVVVDDGQADITEVVVTPNEKRLQGAIASYDRLRWHTIDPSLRDDIDAITNATLSKNGAGERPDIMVSSRTLDDTKWLVTTTASDAPVKYWIYDRPKKKVDFLFTNIKALDDVKLNTMSPVVVRARDGLDLVSYLTKPAGATGPVPMVLFVHGGPWARDSFGLSATHQWLSSRGYAVLSVNYRGSTGFGKKFVNAADKQWAGKMHEDLLDAVAWAVKEKVTEPDKVAIMGGSYGGYSTLVGLTFTPDAFACGVDIVGPSNLLTLLKSIPPYWESEIEQFSRRVGDPRTEEGQKLLLSRSPITFVDKIKRPLLIGQGANDPRVKQAESDTIVKAMQAKSIPVTYVLYPDEGHGFARPENRKSFNAVAEIFLAQCLGGPYQPIGDDFKGATITVPAGKEQISTLGDAIK